MNTQPRPNTAFRAARLALRLSQDEFAERIREAGAPMTKRTVQRYESGEIPNPRPATARALEIVTRLPISSLGFPADVDAVVVDDGRGGHDLEVRHTPVPVTGPARTAGGYSGVWLSRYEFFSSSRESTYAGLHYVVLLQHDDQLTVRSVPGSAASSLTMDLTVDGNVLTGTWTEQTDPQGHYKGARYHGAIQLLAEPTGRRLAGKWIGFGKDMDVNTGPWELTFQDASTSKAALAKFDRRPEAEHRP
ncbi:transcriptional regulator with XRE-family HTH domain [Actinoplanes octamycinicus]|uniref:Transcriptional regulator with XRE-family HTH domain n=1 Tax=Actinoplanes octamycinicus TaxID=135948 RepID=A0A7W7MBD7_9ACTN|nr:helix-turn-helix transcriptional regulator [Actinoplanes octamycinicus]MBB4744034.1 transcriptional regulator with XRE-family HTH domain [Actinoplanes octamycinicus]GIE58659.1 hypothetical protein Aoc01nite_40610 [Actinoplanes octamycinicus]